MVKPVPKHVVKEIRSKVAKQALMYTDGPEKLLYASLSLILTMLETIDGTTREDGGDEDVNEELRSQTDR